MAKRKRRKKPQNLPRPKPRSAPILLAAIAVAALAVAGSLFLYQKYSVPAVQKKEVSGTGHSASKASVPAPSDHLYKLVGRWRRPDGGYIIDIRNVDAQGNLRAAYFNPRSIHVSRALAEQRDGKTHVLIELRDRGYPGATYSLIFDPKGDVLAGSYFQPTAGGIFDVVFVRAPSQ